MVAKQFRKKFENTYHPGIFLGYDETNHTAFKFFDTTSNKLVLSRSVVFFENEPGNTNAPTSPPEFLNFLPNYEIGGNNNDNNIHNNEEVIDNIDNIDEIEKNFENEINITQQQNLSQHSNNNNNDKIYEINKNFIYK